MRPAPRCTRLCRGRRSTAQSPPRRAPFSPRACAAASAAHTPRPACPNPRPASKMRSPHTPCVVPQGAAALPRPPPRLQPEDEAAVVLLVGAHVGDKGACAGLHDLGAASTRGVVADSPRGHPYPQPPPHYQAVSLGLVAQGTPKLRVRRRRGHSLFQGHLARATNSWGKDQSTWA